MHQQDIHKLVGTSHPNLLRLALLASMSHPNALNTDVTNVINNCEISVAKVKRILICCNWCSSQDLISLWSKMRPPTSNIVLVDTGPCDYYCVINKPPPDMTLDLSKTILFRMEPNMSSNNKDNIWGGGIVPSDLLYCGIHENSYLNVAEWHLAKSWQELNSIQIDKDKTVFDVLSTVLSDKYKDPGHIKRVDFVKFLEGKGVHVDVFGSDRFLWKNYKGGLPYHNKDSALFPYRYTFNCENHSLKNYCTEKLYDGILAETLVFYSGCYNIVTLIDPEAYVYLELSNFEKDYQTIKRAIDENWWEKRLPKIRKAKQQILYELQVYPRIESVVKNHCENVVSPP